MNQDNRNTFGSASDWPFDPTAPRPAASPATPAPPANYAAPLEHTPDPAAPEASPTSFDDTLEAPANEILATVPLPTPVAVAPPKVPLRHTLARVGEELVAWFKTLVSAAVYATLIVTFGFQVARVEGESMAPTLEDQDRLIVNKLGYRLPNHGPRVGDIVMLLYPNDPDKSFVKRVVAEPGDTIRSVNGHLYRNEVPLPDEFIPEEYRSYDTWGPEILRDGHYFVMGDHRNNSSDSRTWGFVPKKYIIGRVQLRWWPLTEARLFEDWN